MALPQHGSLRSGESQRPSANNAFWLIDCHSSDGTFVNGKRITARRLRSGDLVQAGPYAWQFSHSDGSSVAFLDPQDAISGGRVRVRGAEVRRRLGPLDVEFVPGELAAIRGPSGAGKSTLVKAIIGDERLSRGRIFFDACDVNRHRDELRGRLGYVSQALVIHEHLTARQVVEFAVRFRGRQPSVDDEQVNAALRSVDLPEKSWDAKVNCLSGGEQQRVKIAVEVVNKPDLFVLDEPTSGLDKEREDEVLRMLHVVSRRGATVLVVTHGERGDFDRTVELEKGGKLRRVLNRDRQGIEWSPVDAKDEAMRAHNAPGIEAAPPGSGQEFELWGNAGIRSRGSCKNGIRQGLTHVQREWALLGQNLLWRLALPLLAVPALFAVALFLSVPSGELRQLGFLSVLCCIWMGASLSLLSIAEERRVIEHERLVFLDVCPYMSAKMVFLLILSFFQCLLFAVLLGVLQRLGGRPDDILRGGGWMFLALCLVGFASVGMGLLLSAVSGSSGVVAIFLLPLVMIAQIVFSVGVAVDGDSFSTPYDHFSWSSPTESRMAATLSYVTLSRWGDMAVRPLQIRRPSSADYWQGLGVLGCATFALPLLAGLMVRWTRPALMRLQPLCHAITNPWRRPELQRR